MLIKMPKRWRRRRGQRGRAPKQVNLTMVPSLDRFVPTPHSGRDQIDVDLAELEALRLVDLEGSSQEEAGEQMGVSRGTVWRLLQSARKKVVQALIEARTLRVTR